MAIRLDKSLAPVSRSTPKQPPSWGHSQKQVTGVNTPVLLCSEPAPSCTLPPKPCTSLAGNCCHMGRSLAPTPYRQAGSLFWTPSQKDNVWSVTGRLAALQLQARAGYLLSLLPAQPRKHTASIRKALTSRLLEYNLKLQISYMHRLNMMFQTQSVTFSLLQPDKHRMAEIKTDNKLFCRVIFYIIFCLLPGRQKNCIPDYCPKKKVVFTLQRDQRKA